MPLASALALAACGGGDGDDDVNGDAPLSAAQYRAQLARLCTGSEREATKIGGVQGANAAALAEYFDEIAAVQTRRRAQFERLRPPAELRDEHAQIEPLLAEEIASIKQAATSFRAGSGSRQQYDTFKTTQIRVLRRQYKVLDELKRSRNAGQPWARARAPRRRRSARTRREDR